MPVPDVTPHVNGIHTPYPYFAPLMASGMSNPCYSGQLVQSGECRLTLYGLTDGRVVRCGVYFPGHVGMRADAVPWVYMMPSSQVNLPNSMCRTWRRTTDADQRPQRDDHDETSAAIFDVYRPSILTLWRPPYGYSYKASKTDRHL